MTRVQGKKVVACNAAGARAAVSRVKRLGEAVRTDLGICLVLAAVTLAVYAPVREYDFVNVDDPAYVSENPHVLAGLTWDGLRYAFTAFEAANWHPLTWLSLMLDGQLFGSWAGGYHLVNVGLHIAGSLLVFFVFKRLTANRWASAMVAALFALHPLHVESVAWVSEHKDVLSTVFWMLTLGAYVLYAERPSVLRYMAVFGLLALGLMAKPMLVTLPFVLLLLDYWPLGRLPKTAAWKAAALRLVAEKIPLLLLAAAASGVTYIAQRQKGAMLFGERMPFTGRLSNAVTAYVAYLAKTIWPGGLSIFYPYDEHLPAWEVGLAAAALVAVTALVVWQGRRRPYLAVGWFWYVGTLVPVIGLVQVGAQAMADRYTYVPLIGVFLAVVWGLADLVSAWRGRRALLATVGASGVAACLVLTAVQVQYWSDGITLFRRAVEVTPKSARAHADLGDALFMAKRYGEAEEELIASLQIEPWQSSTWHYKGLVLAEQHRMEEAIAAFREALRLKPSYVQAHHGLAMACAAVGRWPEAFGHAQEAARLAPEQPVALNNLAWILATCPDPKVRDGSEAVRLAERVCELTGRKNPTLLDTLAAAYAEAGRFDEAVRTAEEARSLALAGGTKPLADVIGERLELYRSGRPWREGRPGPGEESVSP